MKVVFVVKTCLLGIYSIAFLILSIKLLVINSTPKIISIHLILNDFIKYTFLFINIMSNYNGFMRTRICHVCHVTLSPLPEFRAALDVDENMKPDPQAYIKLIPAGDFDSRRYYEKLPTPLKCNADIAYTMLERQHRHSMCDHLIDVVPKELHGKKDFMLRALKILTQKAYINSVAKEKLAGILKPEFTAAPQFRAALYAIGIKTVTNVETGKKEPVLNPAMKLAVKLRLDKFFAPHAA